MGDPSELESRAAELFAEYVAGRDSGQGPDIESLLARDHEVAPYLKKLLDLDYALFPSLERKRINDYLLGRVIGRGGMGIVYEAEQISLKRRVALKILPRIDAVVDPESLGRFRREMTLLSGLDHPHIVPVFDAGEVDGRPYFVMPLLQGRTLAELLRSMKKDGSTGIDEKRAVTWMRQIADSLDYIHRRGIVHRDVKPSNIFIDEEEGDARLLDFGLARSMDATGFTRTNQVLGTPAYMSPEQIEGGAKKVGPHTDLYLLGAAFFEALTLQRPFERDDTESLRRAILRDPPPRPSRIAHGVSRDFETLILNCLQKKPAKRFRPAGELAAELDRLKQGVPIRTRRPPIHLRLGLAIGFQKRTVFVSSILMMVLVIAAIYYFEKFIGEKSNDITPSNKAVSSAPLAQDPGAFNFEYSFEGGYFTKITSATGQPVMDYLINRHVPISFEGEPLCVSAELDSGNETFEVVSLLGGETLIALKSPGKTSKDVLWRNVSENRTDIYNLIHKEDFNFRKIIAAPNLLARGMDALVLVFGKWGSSGSSSPETVIMIFDETGRSVCEYRLTGTYGWTSPSVNVVNIVQDSEEFDRPELLFIGYKLDTFEYPCFSILAIRMVKAEGVHTSDSSWICKTLRCDLPVTVNDPDQDYLLQQEADRNYQMFKNTNGKKSMAPDLQVENNTLSYISCENADLFYTVRYSKRDRIFEWFQIDYHDAIQSRHPQNNQLENLPDDPEDPDFHAMQQQVISDNSSWY